MPLRPAFQIGLWNAWIIEVLGLLTFLPTLMSKEALKKRPEGEPTWSELSKTDKAVFLIIHPIIVPFTLIYSIFLPLKLGTAWFYVGLPICLLALLMNLMAGVSFATTPPDEPVTKGIYRVSRNPAYFGIFLMFIGIGAASASWIFLLSAALWITSWHILVRAEERFCLDTYGDPYREHLNTTPRWIGLPKSGK